MLFSKSIVLVVSFVLLGSVSALPFSFRVKRDVNPSLVPSFGWKAGLDPDGTGNCAGAVNGTDGKPIQVPCQCPPNSTFFHFELNKNVAAGFAVNNPSVKLSFPTDNSIVSQSARLNAAAVTLQNLEGPGVGCPISSTTFMAQGKAINAEPSSSARPRATPAISTSPANPIPTDVNVNNHPSGGTGSVGPTDAQIAAFAPPLGWKAGINPDGTGNCDGAINGTDGKPIQIPCKCPPDQADYISNLTANIRAGHVVLNPSVKLSFPTDNSTASQSARLNAAASTLQSLNGPGKGCPVAGTTFATQQRAINAETALKETSAPTPPARPVPTNAINTTSGSVEPTDAQITALAPAFGWKAGINPDGHGNCNGAINGTNGMPILIPCHCPPDQADYISNLTANVRAEHALLNPTVKLSFPTDNSTASQNARLNAAAITLQNLNGPGKGCPVAATTFAAQQKAINAENSN